MARSLFRVYGTEPLALRLRDAAGRTRDVSSAWPRVGDVFADEMKQQFESSGAHFGKPWKALGPWYSLWKVRSGMDPRPLIGTGRMMRSFTERPLPIEEYHARSAVFGSDSEIAPFHQTGTRRGLPARPILPTTKRGYAGMQRRTRNVLRDFIIEGR